MVEDSTENGRIETTTDHETIRRWIEERGSTAARVTEPTGNDPGSLAVVPEGTDDESVEEITWEEFFRIFEEENLAFVYQTARDDPNERWFCRFIDREREVSGDAFEAERSGPAWNGVDRHEGVRTDRTSERVDAVDHIEDVSGESAVEEGEIAETEITRTEIVEREVVITDRVRSRVVDSEIVERNTLDSEVVGREVDRCEIIDDETIETEVLETRRMTEEVFEAHTVESEVVDRETVERERSEDRSDTIGEPTTGEPTVELADSGLEHGTIIENEVVRRDLKSGTLVEGEVLQTEVVERRVVETEVVDRIRIRSDIESVERIDGRLVESEIVESGVIDRDSDERAVVDATADEEFGSAATNTAASEPTEATAPGVGSEGEPSTRATEAETGKAVVNARGEEIGVVSTVQGGTLYVDPSPGLAERVRSSLGWGSDDESYPIDEERITRIDDDEIEIVES